MITIKWSDSDHLDVDCSILTFAFTGVYVCASFLAYATVEQYDTVKHSQLTNETSELTENLDTSFFN